MKVLSTNIGGERILTWKEKTYRTGIFKEPVKGLVNLQSLGVEGDHINNLKVHGGLDKACYTYGANYFDFWKAKYPHLNWNYGMFGENLTIDMVDESKVLIGDVYKLGGAIVQVSQPRQPCNKFGAKFGSMKAIEEFIKFGHPGIYLRVIQEGEVCAGDAFELEVRNESAFSVQQIFRILYKQEGTDLNMAQQALHDSNLAASCKEDIHRFWHID